MTGADGRSIARAVRSRGVVDPVFVETVDDLAGALADVLKADDVVLTLGAGSIGGVARTLPGDLAVNGPVEVRK